MSWFPDFNSETLDRKPYSIDDIGFQYHKSNFKYWYNCTVQCDENGIMPSEPKELGELQVYASVKSESIHADGRKYTFLEGIIHFKDEPPKMAKPFNVLKPVEDLDHLANIIRHYACEAGTNENLNTTHIQRYLDDTITIHNRDERSLRDELKDMILKRLGVVVADTTEKIVDDKE